MKVKYSIVEKRWENHEKMIQLGISFQPAYVRLIKRSAAERGLTQREVIEEALKGYYGDPKEGSEEGSEK